MKCEYCGGEVNLSVGRCTSCGKLADEEFSARIVHDLSSLADRYGIKVEEEEENEEIPALFSQVNRKKKSNDQPVEAEPRKEVYSTFELPQSLKGLMDNFGEDDIEPETEQSETEADVERSEEEAPLEQISEEESAQSSEGEGGGFISTALRKIDAVTEKVSAAVIPIADKALEKYREKVPQMKRARESTARDRLAVIGVAAALFVAVIIIISTVSGTISRSLRGEWQIARTGSGEVLTIEFHGARRVTVYTYQDGERHELRAGRYKTRRKNGHNLLTITYENGDESRLYYEIDGDEGTFTNVDSNRSSVYTRVKNVKTG